MLRTPFGWPVAWAEVRLTGSLGAAPVHDSLVVSARRLGRPTPNPFDDFLLCLLAAGGAPARLALGAFVEAFLASDEVDVLWRLRDGVMAADARLAGSVEGPLSATLTALFVASDGTAYGVSVGDLPLLVFGPRPDGGAQRPMQKLGHERDTCIGGDTRPLDSSGVVEQWWPELEGGGARLEPGTLLELGAAGAARSTQSEAAAGAGIALRFDGGQVSTSQLVADSGWLVSLLGCGGGGGTSGFGLACLGDEYARGVVPGLLSGVLESRNVSGSTLGLEHCFEAAGGDLQRTRLAVVAWGLDGGVATFASAGGSVERGIWHGPSSEVDSDAKAFTLRLGSGSDPLDRGVLIEFGEGAEGWPRALAGSGQRRWWFSLARWWRMRRRL